MIVVCNRATKRLIKGHRYEVKSLYNDGTNSRYQEGKIFIDGVGGFVVSGFRTTDGKELPKVNYISNTVSQPRFESYKFEELSKGDILVCRSSNYKTFVKDGRYKVESLESKSKSRTGWNGTITTYTENYIKFEGIKRKMKFNVWSFRKLNTDESREISLSHLLDGEDPKFIIDASKRNIDLVEDKDDVLLKNLAKAILDPNRHHLTITQWAEKIGDKLNIESSDYNDYMNLTLSQVLSMIK